MRPRKLELKKTINSANWNRHGFFKGDARHRIIYNSTFKLIDKLGGISAK